MKLRQRASRLISLLLCAALLWTTGVPAGLAEQADAPTETAAQTDAPTDTPAPTATQAPTDTPAPTATPAPTDTPVSTDTPAPTGVPDATATPGASVAPDATATPETSTAPDATATPALTPEATATPDPDAPPSCTKQDCTHVSIGENGKLTALCDYGAWLLAHAGETALSVIRLMAASAPTKLTLENGQTTTISRSGSYEVSGGNDTSSLRVAGKCLVSITLQGVTLGTLKVDAAAIARVGFDRGNRVDALVVENTADVTLTGYGALLVRNLNGSVTCEDGSIRLPRGATSLNERKCYGFAAKNATSATLDGAYLVFTTADPEDGGAYFWLDEPPEGSSYKGSVKKNVLEVVTQADDPVPSDTYNLTTDTGFVAVAGRSYTIVAGNAPKAQELRVDAQDVSLVLDGVSAANVSVAASVPTRLHIGGTTTLAGVAVSGKLSVTGAGALIVGALSADKLGCSRNVNIRYQTEAGGWANGWRGVRSPIDLTTATVATYNGKRYAVAFADGSRDALLPLPQPSAGKDYLAVADGDNLTIELTASAAARLILGNDDITITNSGNYVVVSNGTVNGSVLVADGLDVELMLRSVVTRGALTVGAKAKAVVWLDGSSQLRAGVSVGRSGKLTFKGEGALQTPQVSTAKKATTAIGKRVNLTLTNASSLGGSSRKPTVITVTDASGAPLKDAEIGMRLGTDKPFTVTTTRAGLVTLWDKKALSGVSVAVLSDTDAFAAIVNGSAAAPDALPDITKVEQGGYSQIKITAKNAKTIGIQYYINRAGDMPDTYDANAGVVYQQYGECNIPKLKKGDTVTYRAFAAVESGKKLAADNADAFRFSEQKTFTAKKVRAAFSLADQLKTYDGVAFAFAQGLIPSDASLTYYKGTRVAEPPVKVGEYVCRVAIPSGNATYLPGVYKVKVTIAAIVVVITPDEFSKMEGEEDPPEFTYSYEGTLAGDKVKGKLHRAVGEKYGNYEYLVDELEAADYYHLVIDAYAPMFFIDRRPRPPIDPLSIIDPIHQLVTFADGVKLDLILKTSETLTISGKRFGSLVTDTLDRKARPFTPQLRIRHGFDDVLLLLHAEPELNGDGGYATDADGKRVLRGRALTLTLAQLNNFSALHITALGLQLDGATVLVDLTELQGETVELAREAAGLSRVGIRYRVTIEPVNGVGDVTDAPADARYAAALGMSMARVRVEAVNGDATLDLTGLTRNTRLLFDASALLATEAETNAQISELIVGQSANEQAAEPTVSTLELALRLAQSKLTELGAELRRYVDPSETLDSRLVVPYTASETETIPYTAILDTRPYLLTSLTSNGLYGLSLASARPSNP